MSLVVGKKEKEIVEKTVDGSVILLFLVQRIKKEKGTLPPPHVAKHVIQSLYTKMKPGVDGVTQYAALFYSQTSKLEQEQNTLAPTRD
jgi:hypothetical protein